MRKRLLFYLPALFLFWTVQAQQRGDLVFESLLHYYDPAEIRAVYEGFDLPELFFPIHYSVEVRKVVYRTPAATGDSLTLASGLVALPVSQRGAFPLLVYNHGSLPYDSIVSEWNARFDQHLFGIPFAANGYAAALPDYLGYGATPLDHPHPYLHAKSEATAVVDMLRAARALCQKLETRLNGQVFLLGYSQGGHVNMAAHRELQTLHADEFTVAAAAPCSGPYDLSGLSRDSLLLEERFAHPQFITFTALSYQYVYGNIYEKLEDVFVDPYPELIRRIYDRRHPESFLFDELPYPGLSMFDPLFYEEVLGDPDHPFNAALRDNDVYDWIPLAPVRLYYCKGDSKVPYQNALFAADHMRASGASDVAAVMAGEKQDHEECTYPALIFAKLWFDNYRVVDGAGEQLAAGAEDLYLYPNPFEETLYLGGSPNRRPQYVRVYDTLGRQVYAEKLAGRNFFSIPSGSLTGGSYLFELLGDGWRYRQVMVRI